MRMTMKTRISQKARRRSSREGMASLEFVLALPFLVFIMAIVFTFALMGVKRTESIQQARYDGWKMRDHSHNHQLEEFKLITDTKPMQVLDGWNTEEMAGEISGADTVSMKSYSFLRRDARTINSPTAIIHGTWDQDEITIFRDNEKGSHFALLGNIAGLNSDFSPLNVVDQIINVISF